MMVHLYNVYNVHNVYNVYNVYKVHNYDVHNVHGAGPYSLLRIRCHLSGLHSVAGKCALMEVA